MKLRIDYHFHPNLPKDEKKAINKCKLWWENFKKNNINCIIVTEHAYKNAKRAFNLMNKTKPKGFFCFPGIEYVSKEGVDLVVFSNKSSIYSITKLNKPFSMSYLETLKLVKNTKDLFAFVTHPYTIGLTSVVRKLGDDIYRKALDTLGAVEISNGAFDRLFLLVNPLRFILKSKIEGIKKTQNLPKEDYPKKIEFLAVGSDAHQFTEIGNYFEVNSNNAFNAVSQNKGKGKIIRKKKKFNLNELMNGAVITLSEFLIKKRLK